MRTSPSSGRRGRLAQATARLLGLTHQTLGSILNTRHRQLSAKRKPPQKRLKSIIKEVKEGSRPTPPTESQRAEIKGEDV